MRNLPFWGWEVNTECNYNCVYCYNCGSSSNEASCPPDESLNEITDFFVSQQPVSVTLSGGEVLLIFDRLKPYMEKLLSNRIQVRILSNGSLITEEIAQFCAMWDIHYLVSFPSVSRQVFGAVTGQPNAYNKALIGMDLLKKYGVVFQPNVVVTTANLDTVEETVRFLWQRYAPPSVMVSRATAPTNAESNVSDILLTLEQLNQMFDICTALSEHEKIPVKTCGGFALCTMSSQKIYDMFGKVCGNGRNSCVITSNGDVRVCARDSRVYGNVFREPFDMIRHRMSAWRNAPIPKACRKCRMAQICRGGCHMSSVEPERGPESLDCHARPQRKYFIHFQRRPSPKLRLLRHYHIMPFVTARESDCARLSVGNAFDYFSQEIVDYLNSHEEITLLSALRLCPTGAFTIMRKLLRVGVIQG